MNYWRRLWRAVEQDVEHLFGAEQKIAGDAVMFGVLSGWNAATNRAAKEPRMADKDPLSTYDDEEEDPETAARLDAEAEADIAAGQVVAHQRVLEWLEKLCRGERVPPPKA